MLVKSVLLALCWIIMATIVCKVMIIREPMGYEHRLLNKADPECSPCIPGCPGCKAEAVRVK